MIIFLNQKRCVTDMLTKLNINKIKVNSSLMKKYLILYKDMTNEKSMDPIKYRDIVRQLRHITQIKLKNSYLIGIVNRFLQHLQKLHLKAIKNIVKYLKEIQDYNILYKK